MLNARQFQHLWFVPLITIVLWSIGGFTSLATAQVVQHPGIKPADVVRQLPDRGEEPVDPNLPLGVSFVINVSVMNEPEPSGHYTVLPAGLIEVHVAEVLTPVSVVGLTPVEAGKKLTEFLKGYMKDPVVTVSIVSVPQAFADIWGAVKVQGSHPISRHTTLAELLSKSEWADQADISQVRIIRSSIAGGKEKTSTLIINLGRYLLPEANKTPDDTQNPFLVDKDTVFVPFKPRPTIGTFSITGEVAKASFNIPVRTTPPLTLREAMALVNGTTPNANRKKVTIVRPGLAQALMLDLDKADLGDAVNNVEIHADDAVYVEKLGPKAFVEVNGGFMKPGKLPFDGHLTLTQAVMEAGGPTPFAKEQEGMILRFADDDSTKTQMIPFKLLDIMKHKSQDLALNAGDAVYIPVKAPSLGGGPLAQLQGLGPLSILFNTFFGRNGIF